MEWNKPVHAPEAADGTTEPAVALHVAQGSAVHGGLAQMFTPPDRLTGVGMGFSGRGMAGDLQVGLGFRPGLRQQPDPAPEPTSEQQPPQPVDAVADDADGPYRPAPGVAAPGSRRLGRRAQVAWSNPSQEHHKIRANPLRAYPDNPFSVRVLPVFRIGSNTTVALTLTRHFRPQM